jgi:hypothetical protein
MQLDFSLQLDRIIPLWVVYGHTVQVQVQFMHNGRTYGRQLGENMCDPINQCCHIKPIYKYKYQVWQPKPQVTTSIIGYNPD